MVDDTIVSAVRVGASIGGGVGGAVGIFALIWRYGQRLIDYFGGDTETVGYQTNGLGRLRGEVSNDIGVQLGNLEDRVISRLMEVRAELRQNMQEIREDVKEHKKECNGRFAELERGNRYRSS